jgi:hypothetical protein
MNHGVISYGRWNAENTVICVFNNTCYERKLELPVWKAGLQEAELTRLILTYDGFYDTEAKVYGVKNGVLEIAMPPQSSYLFGYNIKEA